MTGSTQMVPRGRTTFDLDHFVADCREALAVDKSHKFVCEVVKRAVAEPASILKTLGEPKRAELQTLYCANDLTVLNLIWGPNMVLLPHDHRMWAVIGIYSGREDNIFWRRENGPNGKLEAVAAKALSERDAEPLGHNIIHSVINPIPRLTAAIHVYGGNFFAAERSEWDPETLSERRFDPERLKRRFEEANRNTVRCMSASRQSRPSR